MVHIQAKGKGALVMAIGVFSFIVVFVLASVIINNMSIKMPNEFYQLLGGLSLLVASVVTRITCYEDDENPDGFPSTFMYIPVVYWTHIYAVLGMIVIADAAITYYKLM